MNKKKRLHHPKRLVSSFSKSFIPSDKKGGGAAILREGPDTVTRGTCVSASKQLRKSS
jgi:hypothetical protein